MNPISLHDQSNERGVADGQARSSRTVLGVLQRVRWRDALTDLLGAAFRVHHYRDIRTRMLREALCDADCRCYICEAERKLQ